MDNSSSATPAKRRLPKVVVALLVLLAACILLLVGVFVVLSLLGPPIGNVFSNITPGLLAPTP